MRKTLFIISLFSSLFACKKNLNIEKTNPDKPSVRQNIIKIAKDTFDVSMNGRINKVALFNDKFYCMFESNSENYNHSKKKMFVLNNKGKFIEEILVPKGIQDMIYYDFKSDQNLYIKRAQFDEENFMLEKSNSTLKLVANKKFIDYEDEKYNVFSVCNGEFGGTIYFEDKKTNIVYEAASTCPIAINKFNNKYFITNYLDHMMHSINVIEISNPKELQKSKFEFDKKFGSRSTLGFEKILDTSDFYMLTTFIASEKLLHLYLNEKGTFLGEIIDNKLVPIYKFSFTFYAGLNQLNKNGQQILTFNIIDSKHSGILIIQDENLKFNFIK